MNNKVIKDVLSKLKLNSVNIRILKTPKMENGVLYSTDLDDYFVCNTSNKNLNGYVDVSIFNKTLNFENSLIVLNDVKNDYPLLGTEDKEVKSIINSSIFNEDITDFIDFVSKEEKQNLILKNVLFDSNNKIIAATDGTKLFYKKNNNIEYSFVLTTNTIRILSSILKDERLVSVNLYDNKIEFTGNGWLLISNIQDVTTYPDLMKVIPTEGNEVKFNTNQLKILNSAIDCLLPFTDEYKRIIFEKNELRVCNIYGNHYVKTKIPFEFSSDYPIMINVEKMKTVLSKFEKTGCSIRFPLNAISRERKTGLVFEYKNQLGLITPYIILEEYKEEREFKLIENKNSRNNTFSKLNKFIKS